MDVSLAPNDSRPEGTWKRYRCGLVGLFGLLLLACAVLLSAHPAAASVVEALSLSELVKRSEHVVLATAGEHMGRRSGNLIVTDVQLKVDEGFKGGSKPGDTLIATLLGGVNEGVGLKVPGEAVLLEGTRFVVFLRRTPQSKELRVVGMAQGALPVQQRDGKAMIFPPTHDVELMQRGGDGRLQKGEGAVPSEIALPDLLSRIRSLVASIAPAAR
jgi:hypothetical protein